MRFGITGHQRLEDNSAWAWVRREIFAHLPEERDFTGVSSLAIGADQLFAECVLHHRGSLIAIIPFSDYERTFKTPEEKSRYLEIRQRATEVRVLPNRNDDQQSYLDAGHMVVDLCDILFAVWDGKPAKGKGGTGDAVEYALRHKRDVVHINPNTLTTTELKAK